MVFIIDKTRVIFYLITFNIYLCLTEELFSASTDMESLIKTYKVTMNKLDRYIYREEKRLNILEKYLNRFQTEHEIAKKSFSKYLENPINAFGILKRLSIDLEFIEQKIKDITVYKRNTILSYPSRDDMMGVVLSLTRLRNTYLLNVSEIADGVLKGTFSRDNLAYTEIVAPMSASDCYELGRALYGAKEHKEGIDWILEAYRKYSTEKHEAYSFNEGDLIEHISYAYFALDDVATALEWNNKMLSKLRPGNPRYTKYTLLKDYYENVLAEAQENTNEIEDLSASDQLSNDERVVKEEDDDEDDIDEYGPLCRNEMKILDQLTKWLKCRYLTETHPFLRLAPVKQEQLYQKPDLYMFYDVLSDGEITHLIKLATPQLERAKVQSLETGKIGPMPFRVSKIAMLTNRSEVLDRISRRVSDITGLSTKSGFALQVANYATGGFFGPHYDFIRKNSPLVSKEANRLATMLFYLSNVEQGGATVFTRLGLTVFPEKGAAIFWMNLHPSGQGDLSMRHAGCPVLRGSKWVANQWMSSYGQELQRPCNLQYQTEGILHKLSEPILKQI